MQTKDYLPYIDLDSALRRLNNNRGLYFKLLATFNGNEMMESIKAFANSEEWVKCGETAHGLKGVAANLGLNDLAEKSLVVESAGKNGTGISPEMISSLEESLNTTMEKIKQLSSEDV